MGLGLLCKTSGYVLCILGMKNPSVPSLQTPDRTSPPSKLDSRAGAGQGAAAGKRCHVTVLFSDLTGSSEHAERLEAEIYSAFLADFRGLAREIVAKHGGNIARVQGDGLLAIFGYPIASEDDGRRATEAALELHARVGQVAVGGSGTQAIAMQLHSGIHAGLALLTEGDIERGRFDVVGEVVNTAARLCSLAAADEVMVSEETLGPQAHFFQWTPLGKLVIKGRAAPLDVLRVLGRALMGRRIDAAARRGVVSFAGRHLEMAQLEVAAQRARGGGSPSLLLVGEAGIGKTRLIDEFQSRLDPAVFRVLQGYCENYLGAEPLQPFMHWIRSALGWQVGATLPENELAVATALGLLGDTAASDFEPLKRLLVGGRNSAVQTPQEPVRISVITEFLSRLSLQKTLVLILDDWQWADDASRRVLESLNAMHLSVFVLVAARPGDDETHGLIGIQTLTLQPLAFSEGADAIAAWLPSAEPFATQEIYRLSGGSPLFIEELCHAATNGSLQPDSRNATAAWINALVASRLARLPESHVEFLQVAAVVGNVFAAWLLDRLTEPAQTDSMLQVLSAQDFLVAAGPPGMLRFKHVLTRDAVYATVNPARRRILHLRVAHMLESTNDARGSYDWIEALSYHHHAAGSFEKTAYFAEIAGDKALAAMALDRARAQFIVTLRALDTLAQLDLSMQMRWCAVAQKLGQTCVFDPLDVSHDFALFERAVSLAQQVGDENMLARAEYWLAYMHYGKGRPREAVRHSEAALKHALASNDVKLVAQVEATLGQSLASAGQYQRALPMFTQAIVSKKQQSRPGSGTAIGSAYTHARLAYTYGDIGRFDLAQSHFDEALLLLGDAVHIVVASVRELMCAVALWQGRWADAQVLGQQGTDMALRCRSRYMTAMGRALGACGAYAMDGNVDSLRTLRKATQWIEDRGGAVSTSLNYGWLVQAAVDRGETDQARQNAAKLFQRARAHDRHGHAMGCRAMALQSASTGDLQRAHWYLEQAERCASLRQSVRERAENQLALAQIQAYANQLSDARSNARLAHEAFSNMGMSGKTVHALAFLENLQG